VADASLGEPEVSEYKMFGSPALRSGKKVFACLAQDRLVVKLPAARVSELTQSGAAEPFDPGMGRVMREWASVAPSTAEAWVALAHEARAFVDGLRG